MVNARPIRVALFDEHLMCLESLSVALTENKVVVGSTTSLPALPDLIEQWRPDVCLVELAAPDRDVVVTLSQVVHRTPASKVIAVVDDLPVAFVREVVAAGVRGFARRDSTLRALNDVVDRVAAGQVSVGVQALLRPVPSATRSAAPPPSMRHSARLTARENQVLDHLVAGKDTRHIAAALKISRSTARTHVESIRLKLGAQTRLQAVALAVGPPGTPSRADDPARA